MQQGKPLAPETGVSGFEEEQEGVTGCPVAQLRGRTVSGDEQPQPRRHPLRRKLVVEEADGGQCNGRGGERQVLGDSAGEGYEQIV
ncbi:hypothetical protein [Parafrankia discariae]|uniref:hypothetical protein n=1 Tax=Parafrankia discariae TaxID=365528 RepID=UPI000360FF63|nr:hypothetical protein [Parafrankia discariae]